MARHTIKFRQYVLVCAALVGFTRGSNSQNQYDSTYWAAQSELNAFANQAKLQAQQDQFDTLEKQLTLLSDHPKPANEYHLKTGQRE